MTKTKQALLVLLAVSSVLIGAVLTRLANPPTPFVACVNGIAVAHDGKLGGAIALRDEQGKTMQCAISGTPAQQHKNNPYKEA